MLKDTYSRRTGRERCAIAIKTKGQTIYYYNGKEILSDREHVCVLPKNSTYSYFCVEEGECLMIELDVNTHKECELQSIKISNTDELIKLFARIEHALNFKGESSRIAALAGAYALVEKLVDQIDSEYSSPKETALLSPAIKYIEESLNMPSPSNEHLAGLCGVSCVYFRKIFSRRFSMPPSKYITMLKIQRAKGLIIGDFFSMSDVAAACGFSSIYHFSKVFKSVTGITPTEYRRKNRR